MIYTMKNKYIIRSRITERKFRSILLYFCLDIEASKIAKITHISEVTLWRIFKQIRILIAKECENISKMQGEIEIDESYFLLRFTRNCKQKVLNEREESVVGELARKHLCLVCLSAMVAFIHKLSKTALQVNYCLYCIIVVI